MVVTKPNVNFWKLPTVTGMDQLIPKVRLRSCKYPLWFNFHIRHCLNCLRTSRWKLRQHFSIPNLNRLFSEEESLQLKLQAAKHNYEQSLIDNFTIHKDPKIFRYIKNLSKYLIPTVLKYNSISVESDKEKADLFNNFFFLYLQKVPLTLPDLPESNSILTDITIYTNEVFEVLNTVQTTKAYRADNIGPSILKNCAAPLAQPLHFLYTLSLSNGDLPSEWKRHKIIPVFKAGDKSCVDNYWPISLLSNISTVLISHRQFGFCKNKSRLQQLLLYFNDLCSSKKTKGLCIVRLFQSFQQRSTL